VLKALVLNYKQLFLILLMAIIILYFFSFIGFSLYWNEFDEL